MQSVNSEFFVHTTIENKNHTENKELRQIIPNILWFTPDLIDVLITLCIPSCKHSTNYS